MGYNVKTDCKEFGYGVHRFSKYVGATLSFQASEETHEAVSVLRIHTY
jgi:hypothetical protein